MKQEEIQNLKVFSAWDILVIAFGAMIGWGGWFHQGWIQRGGVLGAVIGFALGGMMVFFVGLTYARHPRIPQWRWRNMYSVIVHWAPLDHSLTPGALYWAM